MSAKKKRESRDKISIPKVSEFEEIIDIDPGDIKIQINQNSITILPVGSVSIDMEKLAKCLNITLPDPGGEPTTHPIAIERTGKKARYLNAKIKLDE